MLTVVDQRSRQRLISEVGLSLTGKRVVTVMEAVGNHTVRARPITVDRGTEFVQKALEARAHYHGVELDFSRPDEPVDDGHSEYFNGRLRDECLNLHQFPEAEHSKTVIEARRHENHEHRPTAH